MEKNDKAKVGPGMFVAYSYRLYDTSDNSLVFEATEQAPDVMIYGVSHEIVPGLAAAMKDLSRGDRFEVELPPEAAFGPRNPEFVMELERDLFVRDGKLADEVKVGARLPMITAEGYRIEGEVLAVGDTVKMDFNHPFAGMTVRYEGKVVEVREATPEELKPTHGCGGCHGGCGDGGCNDGGCGCGSEGDSKNCCGGC